MRSTSQRFTSYLDHHTLPCYAAVTRQVADRDVSLVLMDHAPSPGIDYPPVADLIVSIVMQSNYGRVERDVGLGRQVFRETPNSVLITPPGRASYWSFDGTPQVMHIAIPAVRLSEFSESKPGEFGEIIEALASGPLIDPLVGMLAARLWLAAADDSPLGRSFAEHATRALLTSLLLRGVEETEGHVAGTRLASWRCRKAQAFMLARIGDKLTIEEVAAEVGLSACHFVRAFKATLGETPHQWISGRRIDRAKELLVTTESSLTDIAAGLGYSSASHFSSAFRAGAGVSPRLWREEFGKVSSH